MMRRLLGWLLAALLAGAASGPASAEWHEAKSKHFIIYGDMKPGEIKSYAERLESFDQAVRLLRQMPDPALSDANRLTIYVLRNEGSVERLVGGGAYGIYMPRASGSVAIVPRKSGDGSIWDLNAQTVFFHEYAHHLQLQGVSAALPMWIVEGFAEFFATAQVLDDGSVNVGVAPGHRTGGLFYLKDMSIAEIVGSTRHRLTAGEREQVYARGWLLMHYLTFEPSRRGQISRYVELIQQGIGPPEAGEKAFGDLRKLGKDVERYLWQPKLTYVKVDAKRIATGPVMVRQLRPAEAALMRVRVRSERGVNKKSAPGVAADARKAAAPYPNDPFAQTALAEAEHDARNYAAAEAAADRAIAADPGFERALIYKGRARLELARQASDKADWKEVRGWFSRANKLDPDDAEPLFLFYKSYLYSGTAPTPNAIKGLLYAAALVPQDEELRMLATAQLLRDSQLAEAKTMFAPLAFAPHADDKWREASSKILEAIAAGDAKTALGVIEAKQQELEKERN